MKVTVSDFKDSLSLKIDKVRQYVQGEASTIKSRMRFFAVLVVLVYFLGTTLLTALLPYPLTAHDIGMLLFTAFISAILLICVQKVKNIFILKIISIGFITTLIISLAYDHIVTNVPFPVFLFSYIITFFSACLIIPWLPPEVLVIGFLTFLVYSAHYYYDILFHFKKHVSYGDQAGYVIGAVFLIMSFVICFVERVYGTKEAVDKFFLNKEVQEKNKQMQKELELATKVHKRLIPKSTSNKLADIGVLYQPSYFIGGDYAKFHFIDRHRLLFIICDVTGHGVSSALLVNTLHAEFERLASTISRPGHLLKELDIIISKDFAETNMYLTAFCGLIDYSKRMFSYSSYGHLPQYLYKFSDSQLEKLQAQASLIGLALKDEKIYESEMRFARGDTIFLFTDGVTEAANAKQEEFGYKRVEYFIYKNHALEVQDFNNKLLAEISDFTQEKLKDDVFFLNIKTK